MYERTGLSLFKQAWSCINEKTTYLISLSLPEVSCVKWNLQSDSEKRNKNKKKTDNQVPQNHA